VAWRPDGPRRHSFQGDLPGLRGPRFEHSLQFGSGSFRAKKAAPVQRSFVASGFAHGLVELELVDSRQIIPGVGNVGGDVGFGAGVEVGLGARDGWGHPLVVFPKRPPRSVVVSGLGLPGEYLPSPLVDQKAEGEEGHLIKSRAELERDVGLGGRDGVDQVELLEVLRSDGEGDRVANGLVEPVVGAVAKQKRKIAVGRADTRHGLLRDGLSRNCRRRCGCTS